MSKADSSKGKRREIPVHRAEDSARHGDAVENTGTSDAAEHVAAGEEAKAAARGSDVATELEAEQVAAQASSGAAGEDAGGQSDVQQEESAQIVDPMEEIKRLQAERDEHYENWLRARAELDNYRKRIQRELDENARYAAVPVVRDMLPVLDNIRRAVEAARRSKRVDELLQGIEMIVQQFEDVLIKHNAVPIDSVGQPFNPELHEAVQKVETEAHPPMTVVHEVQKGYKLHDRLIRPSKVVVATPPQRSEDQEAKKSAESPGNADAESR